MYAVTLGIVRVCMAGNMNYRQGWAALEIEKWQSWSEMTLRGGTVLPNWHSALGKAKVGPGAQLQLWLQVSIWDIWAN